MDEYDYDYDTFYSLAPFYFGFPPFFLFSVFFLHFLIISLCLLHRHVSVVLYPLQDVYILSLDLN